LPGDDHHFSSAASRAQILQSLENFLGKHLPVS
jgi:dipeptidyl aminopeptidase/acylaminoacyl peptidase